MGMHDNNKIYSKNRGKRQTILVKVDEAMSSSPEE